MTVRFSLAAEADLLSIGEYSVHMWGAAQADRYLSELEDCCGRLARNPLLGRSCAEIKAELRRIEEGRHVIFYQRVSGGILVMRILHQGMLPGRHEMDEAE